MGENKEIFTYEAWRRAFDIREPIYTKSCHEFFSTYECDEEVNDDELTSKKLIKFRLGGHGHSLNLLEFACPKYERYRSLDATTFREFIGPNERLIPEDLAPSVPRFAMPRHTRPILKDLSYRMGRMKIQQGVLDIPLAGDYAPPSYDEEQQQQYCRYDTS
ncbi:hypothetical protein Tco_0624734 [Tanacetum coccineum]|uniref:Uncharacterized protein n=1 Tax=Tanacetum coccineum TaxID=301880 RepID=A0ABQ4WEV5_9ASTR